MRHSLPFFILFLCSTTLFGQFNTELTTNPSSLRWNQINTPNFRILFPEGFEEQGQRMANTMEHIRTAEAQSLGNAVPRRISIILQNQSALSNGFVSMLPRRSEFYAMPSQNYNFLGSNDWLDLLASHEYRHIVQYQHATRGFNKVLLYLFGTPSLAGMASAAAPDWFWEGDAVVTETAFTPGGRGKIPYFGLVFRTNLLEGRTFNYHKQYLQSYKHFIPNEYVLGYHMVSYLRRRTNDPEIWGKITARSWNVPFIPFAFSNAIHKETGMYVTELYREMARDLKDQWRSQLDTLSLTAYTPVVDQKGNAYTDYDFPQAVGENSVLMLKSGIGDIETFVIARHGKEEKVFTPGFMNDAGMLSVGNGIITWVEYGYDPRWTVRNYSLIKTYDVKRNRLAVIGGPRERFGSAAISPDGKRIVAVRTGTDYKTALVIFDYARNQVLREIPNPENIFYSMPRWSEDGRHVVALKTTKEGKTISWIDTETNLITDLIDPVNVNIGYPVPMGNYVLYNSPVNGIDNILALDRTTGQRWQVTVSRYGAYNPSRSEDGNTLYYNDQSRNGMDVVSVRFDPATWRPYSPTANEWQPYAHLVEEEHDQDLFKTVPTKEYPVTRYSRFRGMFNPYAWGLNVETDLTAAQIGIASRDLLSTTAISLGYVFDINERTGSYQANVSYQGWYPIIDGRVSYANRSANEGLIAYDKILPEGDTVEVIEDLSFKWKETTIEAGLRLPLLTTRSRFFSTVTFFNNVGYTMVRDFENSIDGGGRLLPERNPQYLFRDYVDNGKLIYNHLGLNFHRLLKRSKRDINSKWGQSLFVNTYFTPYGGDFSGGQFSMYGVLYFPGFFKHHSIWGYGGYQSTAIDRDFSNYIFRNRIPIPRGVSVSRFQQFRMIAVNYALPLWYPDIAIGPLLNIQRFRANMFYDYGHGFNPLNNFERTYASTGVELRADINILRFKPQFDIGVRYAVGLLPSATSFEVLIGTFNF